MTEGAGKEAKPLASFLHCPIIKPATPHLPLSLAASPHSVAPCSKVLSDSDAQFDRCNGTPAFLAPEMMRPNARYRWAAPIDRLSFVVSSLWKKAAPYPPVCLSMQGPAG